MSNYPFEKATIKNKMQATFTIIICEYFFGGRLLEN